MGMFDGYSGGQQALIDAQQRAFDRRIAAETAMSNGEWVIWRNQEVKKKPTKPKNLTIRQELQWELDQWLHGVLK
jgi:hypothetical protein